MQDLVRSLQDSDLALATERSEALVKASQSAWAVVTERVGTGDVGTIAWAFALAA